MRGGSLFELGLGEGSFKESAFPLHQATERFHHCALLVLTACKPKVHNRPRRKSWPF